MKEFKFKTTKKAFIPIFWPQIVINVYKTIKSLMFQSIPSFGMYTFSDTLIPLNSRRQCSLAQYLNSQLLQCGALYPCSLHHSSSYHFHIKNKKKKKTLASIKYNNLYFKVKTH